LIALTAGYVVKLDAVELVFEGSYGEVGAHSAPGLMKKKVYV
jgi:hypothetical protein